jgi:transcription elongation factor Elf1
MEKQEKADVNCFLVNLGSVADVKDESMKRATPPSCASCGAMISFISNLKEQKEQAAWNCEFCGASNMVKSSEAVPFESTVHYVCTTAENKDGEEAEGPAGAAIVPADGLVILCIDVSGSMGVTTELPALQAEWMRLREKNSGQAQNSGPIYISRLECIQLAIQRQLERLNVTSNGRKRVLVVTFDSAVCVIGDGQCKTSRFSNPEELNEISKLVALGSTLFAGGDQSLLPLSESFASLSAVIKKLQPGSATAMGPALALSVGIASSFHGTEIVVCTDGEPNVGVGQKEDPGFYGAVGELALANKTKISIIGIEGSSVSMDRLCDAARVTGGAVNVLHPVELTRELRKLDQNPVVATGGELTFKHSAFFTIKDPSGASVTRMALGNINKDHDLGFVIEFAKEIPKSGVVRIQAQLSYTRLDGTQCLRVITKEQTLSATRDAAEKAVNGPTLGCVAIQHAAGAALSRNFKGAKWRLEATERLLSRIASSDLQSEELYIFGDETAELRAALQDPVALSALSRLPDQTVKLLHEKLAQIKNNLLSGSQKSSVASRRKVDSNIRDQYYGYRQK